MGTAVGFARDLGNHPANILTPTYLSKEAKNIAKDNSKMDCHIFEMKDLNSKAESAFPTCSFCDQQIEKIVFKNIVKFGEKYNIFECLTCQTWITSPKPSIKELSKLYST